MNETVWTHIVYLAVSVGVTIWVGRTLQKHGKIFALNGDEGDQALVDSFSRLLEVGFYLLNFGAINIALRYGGHVLNLESSIELLSTKIGIVLLILGFVQLTMTSVFSNTRKQGGFRDSNVPRSDRGEYSTERY
jgi:hypothetical protein